MSMESESTHRIAIIGGGLSGASILIGLLRSPHHRRLVITVFEPREVLGTGIAYGDAAPWHLLNVVANRASLEPDDPDHWWK